MTVVYHRDKEGKMILKDSKVGSKLILQLEKKNSIILDNTLNLQAANFDEVLQKYFLKTVMYIIYR